MNTTSFISGVKDEDRHVAVDAHYSYVYLCSPAHSGSTLIACLAAAHPHISTVGEFGGRFKETTRCSCDQAYRDCPYWQTWVRLADANGIRFVPGAPGNWVGARADESRWNALLHHSFRWKFIDRVRDLMLRGSYKRAAIQKSVDDSVRLARILCDHDGTFAFLDTTKYSFQVRYLLEQKEMPLKVIALVRDGRGTALSLMKWYGRTFPQAVSDWLWSIRNMQRAIQDVPADRLLHIRFEDLTRDPELQIRRLFEFCGVDPKAPLDYSRNSRHIAGNSMRHKFDGTIRNEESWREKITQEQLDYFHVHAGAVNRIFGYAD